MSEPNSANEDKKQKLGGSETRPYVICDDRLGGHSPSVSYLGATTSMDGIARKAALKRRGTDNVLFDLGFADADELTAKAVLAKKINDIVASRGLTQAATAALLRMPQPKVSAIRNYKLRGISLERLMQALTALGQQVEIVVRPSSKKQPASIKVAA